MTRRNIVASVCRDTGMTLQASAEIIRQLLSSLSDVIARDGRLELRDFGIFEVKQRKAFKARNMKTGESVDVPAKKVVCFKAGRNVVCAANLSRKGKS